MTSPAVEALGLAKRYGRKLSLRNFSITIARGEACGLLGPNGAGKTTAVKLLLGLAHPTSGAGNILGEPLGNREARRHIGYLPELFRYPDWLTAAEVIGVHVRLLGLAPQRRSTEIRSVLERVGLTERAGDRVGSFSKGMQQRLGLAVALAGDPALVVLDEPTSALDPLGRHDVRGIIEDLRARGTAVLLNSHLLTEVERVCDRIAVVDRGEVVTYGTVASMLGSASLLRLRLENMTPAVIAALERRGSLGADPPWLTIDGVAEEAVPSIVAEIIALGAAVYGVDITRATLEERFLALLKPGQTAADNRITHSA